MSLSQLMSAAELTVWPVSALVIFVGVFTLLMMRLARTPLREIDRAARLPIDEH